MDPVKTSLAEIVAGNHRITIPMYQRKYEWEKDKITAFWNDLYKLTDDADAKTLHYMGTMVRQDEIAGNNGLSQFMVIDGQQRITTTTLLMHAIREFLKDTKFDPNDPEVERLLNARVLKYQGVEYADRLHIRDLLKGSYFSIRNDKVKKFIPTEFDRDSFFGLIYEAKPLKRYRHYKHANEFKKRIFEATSGMKTHAERAGFVHKIFDALIRMNLVYIVLNPLDKPQQIFESINYRGKPLSVTDLIRNHVLRVADESVRENVFNQIWKPIQKELQRDEENDGPELFDGFFRAFIAMKDSVASDAEMFDAFKSLYPRIEGETEGELLERLSPICKFASVYRMLANPSESEKDTELGRALYHFSRLNFMTPMSVLMRFHRSSGPHPEPDQMIAALAVLESYYVRRAILNKPVKRMAELFSQICKDYDAAEANGARVPDAEFADWLFERIKHHSSNEFPALGHIGDDLLNKSGSEEVYVNSRTVTKYVLVEREIMVSKDSTKDIVGCEIEHVLPQNYDEHWMHDIKAWNPDQDGKQQPEDTLLALADFRVHHFGNLTLVSPGGNKKLGNKKLAFKKAEKTFGYDNSNYKTTREEFQPLTTWSFAQIDARSEELFRFIAQRFAYKPAWNLKLKVK